MESWHFLRHYAKVQHAHMYDQLGIVIPFLPSLLLLNVHTSASYLPNTHRFECNITDVTSSINDT